jgi:HNH endonuclease
MPDLLNVHWPYGEEYVPIPADGASTVTTVERWNSSGMNVTYNARVEQPVLNHRLVLWYDLNDQDDPELLNPDNEILWGRCQITWRPRLRTGTAAWFGEGNTQLNEVSINMLGGEAPVDDFRETRSAIVKSRPNQGALRNQLLCLDKCCVISGERQADALEAAVIPVKAGGQEVIGNAILLRADIHRLFDWGLFWFEPAADGAEVRHDARLSQGYCELLAGKSLSESTRARVAQALLLRSQLPDGRGRGNAVAALGRHDNARPRHPRRRVQRERIDLLKTFKGSAPGVSSATS